VEIKFEPEEISSILKKQIETYQITVDMEEVGEVIEAGDGIARIKGLPNCMSAEMLEFPHNIFGMALNLEEDNIGAMILGDFAEIEQGDPVKRTGRVLSVPVGDPLIGRVVNAVGQPVDGKGPISVEKYRFIEGRAPNVIQRQPVKEPLQTGLTSGTGRRGRPPSSSIRSSTSGIPTYSASMSPSVKSNQPWLRWWIPSSDTGPWTTPRW
jgi:F-type H+-transporting ATPase subunit alpha